MSLPSTLLAGRYRLDELIATGGMGVVWKGWDELLQRPVAVKQLRTELGVTEEEAELAKNRAMREARITARLHHPHAVLHRKPLLINRISRLLPGGGAYDRAADC